MKSYSWILLLAVACGDDQPISPLHEASRNDDVAAIRSLLESGADIDELDVAMVGRR